eukprot:gnl/TRDRNA2_/TRDRNA2_126159_c0_seq1.p1 gnl/TRDRNA2_/TRDRNA2_126159_c0~~gnl/TRDRNA2_/TRDRNA2_126159_c0_seq1.p1  ORF type:complete len:299 (+),score=48.09 gnl/TRDRNA2_/TRDRNA2_126159_c0_seq1:65-898(+)
MGEAGAEGTAPASQPLLPAGLPPLQASAASVADVCAAASRSQLPFDGSYPGLRVLHADPPVLVIDGFLAPETCQALVDGAERSNSLRPSSDYFNLTFGRFDFTRLTPDVLARGGQALADAQQQLRDNTKRLLTECKWATSGTMPPPGKLSFEITQMSRYESGDYFNAHEDALCREVALTNGYQRRATLKVYLNDVSEGGETHFEHLGTSVRPAAGTAVVFFPSFSDNSPDPRTRLSFAESRSTTWFVQEWISGGCGKGKAKVKEKGSAKAKSKKRKR